MISIRLVNNELKIKIETQMSSRAYAHLMEFLKEFHARYEEANYAWFLPKNNIDALIQVVGLDHIALFNSLDELRGKVSEPKPIDFTVYKEELSDFKLSLYPFQLIGASFAYNRGRALICDEVGLGKSVQFLGAARLFIKDKVVKHSLIICPASLKYQWKSEVEKFTNYTAIVVDGSLMKRKTSYEKCLNYNFTIINHETVRNDLELLKGLKFDLIGLDEAHKIKNRQAKTTKAIYQLDAPFKIGLTGTPMQNRPEELYSLFKWIDPTVLGKVADFTKRYIVTGNKFGRRFVTIGYRNLGELREKIAPYMIRRLKKDVTTDLPEIIYQPTYIEKTPAQGKVEDLIRIDLTALSQEIQEWSQKVKGHMDQQTGTYVQPEHPRSAEIPGLLNTLISVSDTPELLRMSDSRRLLHYAEVLGETVRSPKLEALVEIASSKLEAGHNKIVVFTQFTRMQKLAVDKLSEIGKCEILNGSLKPFERQAAIDRFHWQEDTHFLVMTDAGSEGINAQFADTLIHIDCPWNPARIIQRNGRIHRIGSKHKQVQIIYLITKDSIDEVVQNVLKNKLQLSEELIEQRQSERSAMKDLLKSVIKETKKK